ncbi:putative ADP-ribosylation factor GTPase-activating protein AGD13 [Dendrobium catenatum]|uniref:Putative ADP-ribosylation factor GTPase-activating protein AGD13 n=1 Tax=Dendrobium catenatum TaxID=906689 RepID=A0A2I0W352_9ASPA|nr:putative ADP-ribosylation factor GTPase-activating protein AGD13 [Dendrobium catenatum]
MESLLGLLRVRIIRGVNLAVRDTSGSDPYVVLRMGRQLIFSDFFLVLNQQVYDKDTFSRDDKMGDAELEITSFIDSVKMGLADLPNGTIIRTVKPCRQNCLAGESPILWKDGKIIQEIVLRLRNVETGEIELQLMWIDIPGAPVF